MDLLLPQLARVILKLAKFAVKWKVEPCLAYTHLQPGMSFGTSLLSLECFANSTAHKSTVDYSWDANSSMGSRSHVSPGKH